MNLSKNFTLSEFIHTRTGLDNTPLVEHELAMMQLCQKVLQPLRDWYGKPIKINSGFRSLIVNKAVKGSKTSDHMRGEAADITGGSVEENKILFEYIRRCLPFNQLIHYDFRWIHVSIRSSGNKGEVMRKSKGKYIWL